MDREWGGSRFKTELEENREDGWLAVDLYMFQGDKGNLVSRVCFWDSIGQFTLQTYSVDVPLTILEDLIQEAKTRVNLG